MRDNSLSSLLHKDLQEQLKTYRLWIAIALFLFFGITAPLLTKNLPRLIPNTEQYIVIVKEMTFRDAAAQYSSYIFQMGMLLVILLCMGSVSGERAQGVLSLVLAKPLRRRDVLASKLAVNAGVLACALLLGTAVFYGYTVLLFQYFSPLGILQAIIPAAVFLWFILSLTVFWSVLASSSIAAGGLAFLSALILTVVPSAIPAAKRYGPSYLMEAWPSIVAGHVGLSEVWGSLTVTCVLIAILVIAAMRIFEHRDI